MCSYGLEIAKVFGVQSSILLSCIDSEFSYQTRNNMLNGKDTVAVSRAEIYARTGLNDEEQKDVEFALQECGVLTVKPLQNVPNKNYYILFKDKLDEIVNSSNPSDVIKSSSVKQFVREPRAEPMSKRKAYIAELKSYIKVSDPVIHDYLCQWIDAVYTNPRGYISKKGMEIAQEGLFAYAKTQDVQIALLKIAIKGGLRDLDWAIERYEKQNPSGTRNFASYNDIVAEQNTSSSEVF
jgi:hypothetical protein